MENNTSRYHYEADNKEEADKIMGEVLAALKEKGYDPVNQLVGYFLSGDPTYITNHNGARGVIRRMERDELLEVIMKKYLESL